MEVFISPGEEDKVKSLGYKDKIKFICQGCNKEITISSKYNFRNLFCKHCNTVRTSQEKYGTDNPAQSDISISKQKQTKANKTEEEKKQAENRKKQTMLKKYGVDNPAKSKEIYDKVKKTSIQNYGGVGFASDTLRAKAENTCKALYNKSLHSCSMANREAEYIKKYGVKHPMQLPEVRKKVEETNLKKYGQKHPGGHNYIYKGLNFDSSWELYYYLYLKDNKANFTYHPKKFFNYEYNGINHTYYPDFEVNGHLVEIKGPQFFKDDGTMCNPFDHNLDGVFEAKHQCMIQNGVTVISNIDEEINFINNKYTKDFISLFKDNLPFPYPNENLSDTTDYGIIRHFHKSIWEASKKGQLSPIEAWNIKKDFEKVALNRLKYVGHCKPKDIIRGYSVLRINDKISVFKPQLAEKLINTYLSNFQEIFDPFSGFSGRLIGTANCNKTYIGQDIHPKHVEESNEIIRYKGYKNCSVSQQDILTDLNKTYECLFTCPPYGGKEHWNKNNDEVEKSCDEWIDICLKKYKCKKYLFVVDETEKYKNNIVEVITNKSHFGTNIEYIILI